MNNNEKNDNYEYYSNNREIQNVKKKKLEVNLNDKFENLILIIFFY